LGSILLKALTTTQYIIGVQAVVTIVILFNYHNLLREDVVHGKGDKKEAKLPWFTKDQTQFWLITAALFASTTAEFSVSDWGAILSRDNYKIHAPLYLVPFIFFQAGIIISRLAVNRMSAKMGEIQFVRTSAIGESIIWGISIQIAEHMSHKNQYVTLIVVLVGFFIAGCGVGPVWPTMLTSATKSHYPVTSVLPRLFGFLSLAFVFGPGVIGYLSKHIGLTNALMIPIFSLFVVGLLSKKGLHHEESGQSISS